MKPINYVLVFIFLIININLFSRNINFFLSKNEVFKSIISNIYFDLLYSRIQQEKMNNSIKIKIVDSIIYYSLKYNISPLLVYNIIKNESNFNPYAISNKNAKGLMQLKDIAVKDLKVSLKDSKEIFSINKNIELGIRYLKKMLKKANGNISLALTFYNKGIGKIKRNLKRGFTISQVTKNKYVKRILEE